MRGVSCLETDRQDVVSSGVWLPGQGVGCIEEACSGHSEGERTRRVLSFQALHLGLQCIARRWCRISTSDVQGPSLNIEHEHHHQDLPENGEL